MIEEKNNIIDVSQIENLIQEQKETLKNLWGLLWPSEKKRKALWNSKANRTRLVLGK